MMETSLSLLVRECLDAQKDKELFEDAGDNSNEVADRLQLAENALEERLNELIDSRIAKALANFNPRTTGLP